MKISENFALKEFNSFQIEVNTKKFISLDTDEDFKHLVPVLQQLNMPIWILSGGNNCLFMEDFDGCIIHVNNKGIRVLNDTKDTIDIEISAGTNWEKLIQFALDNNYYGIENLIDIPGRVGAAPIQNIGAYGAEIKDVIQKIEFLDLESYEIRTFSKSECQFAYRNSIFKNKLKGKAIIRRVFIQLKKNAALNTSYGAIQERLKSKGIEKAKLNELAECISEIRATKLPDPRQIGNAGSFFKNPIISKKVFDQLRLEFPELVSFKLSDGRVKLAAAYLIDQCRLKGFEMGNAAVHHKQPLVLVNKTGKAKSHEIVKLALFVIQSVEQKFHIHLEPEVNLINAKGGTTSWSKL